MKTFLLLAIIAAFAMDPGAGGAAEYDSLHGRWDKFLKAHLRDGLFDYSTAKANPSELNSYLDQLAQVTEKQFNGWSKEEQMAYLINLYNAATIRLILDHYPIASIRKIGSIFKGPWRQEVVRLFGKTTDLDTIEHKILRKKYNEPRIHFALVCAALGCPALRAEAYTGARLNEQLEEQGRQFLNDPKKNSFNESKRTLYLSEIFKWFSEDFEGKDGSVQKFVAPYLPPAVGQSVTQGGWKIQFKDYDWSLNDTSRKPK